jgi:Glycosyltransferase family 92
VDYDTEEKHVGDRHSTSQAVSSTGALRRYAHRTTYLAHLDIDEYIIPPANVSDIKSIIRDNESFDFFTLPHTLFGPCDDTDVNETRESTLPWDTSLCYLPDTTPPKSIMKTSRILAFYVHYPTATVDGTYAFQNYTHLDDFMIAHYRGRRPLRDPTEIRFVEQLDVMAPYRETLHQTIDAYMTHFV